MGPFVLSWRALKSWRQQVETLDHARHCVLYIKPGVVWGLWTGCPLIQTECLVCVRVSVFYKAGVIPAHNSHMAHIWSLSAVACCPGLCEASLKYLRWTVRACLPVCFPWCTSPSPCWWGQWKRPLFVSLWGMLHALMTQSGKNYSHYTAGMSLNQSTVYEETRLCGRLTFTKSSSHKQGLFTSLTETEIKQSSEVV